MKEKTIYVCQKCGYNFAKWQGQCSSCKEWNSIIEEIKLPPKSHKATNTSYHNISEMTVRSEVCLLSGITPVQSQRIVCEDKELSRVLGGGIVQGSITLLGGDPGIGKSTLLLQLAMSLQDSSVLYVSGEESINQIKLRAETIIDNCNKELAYNHSKNNVSEVKINGNPSVNKEVCDLDNKETRQKYSQNFYILAENNIENIFKNLSQQSITKNKIPNLKILIIDSIQTIFSYDIESSAGSIAQIRHCASLLMHYAKKTDTAVFLIGHINKEGALAGPKVLEHIVDTVLQFEGDRHLSFRILRTVKNRFGSTLELGIYEMNSYGLQGIPNPAEILLSNKSKNLNGISTGAFIEGNRVLLIEVQSLVSRTTYGMSQRSATGFDYKRLTMLLAVLEKRLKCKLSSQDVFLNIAGGIKIDDPALDLSVCISILSSFYERNIPTNVCFIGEIGLGGEIRPVNRIEQRISEIDKLGFDIVYISKFNFKSLNTNKFNIEIRSFEYLAELILDLKKEK